MHTENVSEVVSDSGITRYRLKAPVWDVYVDDVPEPYAFFPKGILIEQFDSVFNVDGSIRADTAYNYTNRKLWRAVGNVKAVNLKGEKFETSELFWDERSGSIYTDKFMRAERDGKIHAGTGFRSNQTMTHWRILKYNADLGTVAENDSTTSRNKDTTETGE